MSNERFDNRLKETLESVRPAYRPRAWDRFSKRLPAVGFWPWLLQHGGWVLSGLMLTGWLTTLYTLHENQRVLTQLTKAQAVSTTTRPRPGAAVTTHRVDTVYVVQRTIIEHRHLYQPADRLTNRPADRITNQPNDRLANRPDDAMPNQSGDFVQPDAADSAAMPATGPGGGRTDRVIRKLKITLANPIRPGMAWSRVSQTGQPATGQPEPSPERVGSAGRPGRQPVALEKPTLNPAQTPARTPADSMLRAITLAAANLPTDSARTQPAQPPSSVKPDSVAQTPGGAAPPALSATAPLSGSAQQLAQPTAQSLVEPAKESRPPFRLSSLRPRVGMETMVTFNGIGVGPALELFPSENLGISLGIQAAQLQTENHKELRDFNAATGTAFVEQYRAYLPAQYDQIKDISIQTSLVSLPLKLKYYVPLRRNWSLLFQTGTTFDLAAYQQVKYESSFRGEEQYHSFEVSAQPNFFHNFLFGAGVQYQRSRISAQLSPYYLYDFRNLANTPAGSNVGIKASVWLNLFR